MAKKKKNNGAKKAAKAQKRKQKKSVSQYNPPKPKLNLKNLQSAQNNIGEIMELRKNRAYTIPDDYTTIQVTGDGKVTGIQLKPELLELPHSELEGTILKSINMAIKRAEELSEIDYPVKDNLKLNNLFG